MVKNDYKRSLILLRSNESGYSGHVRLEHRVTTGSMAFILQTPAEATLLRAALIGKNKGGYYACEIGDIRRDVRGQMSLNASFDPRNLCGRELNMYRLVAVVRTDEDGCALVLVGNLAGYADMDINEALKAVCALYGMEDSAQPVEGIEVPPAAIGEIAAEDAPEEETAEIMKEPEADPDAAKTALDALQLSDDADFPPAAASVRGMFEDQSPAEDAPDADYVYVRVEGCAPCLIGLRAENGKIVSIAYAVRADYTPDPPEGLEEFSWQGDDRSGWWVLKTDADGERIAESDA